MTLAIDQYPRFEAGSPSSQYQQISNFCVNYLEGLLVSLMHSDLPLTLEKDTEGYVVLQKALLKRERTIRHAFQFRIEKHFADFKSISRTRLHANRSSDWLTLGLAGQNSSRVQSIIEDISAKHRKSHDTRLVNLDKRLKTLVHRTDDNCDDNPLFPVKLCDAFQASIETLNLTSLKTRQLFELFDHVLSTHLDQFYTQIDLGMYFLGVLPELTDPLLLVEPTEQPVISAGETDEPVNEEEVSEILPEITAEPVLTISAGDSAIISTAPEPMQEDAQLKALQSLLQNFKSSTINGSLKYAQQFTQLLHDIEPYISPRKLNELTKFSSFYTNLLNNTLLSVPLKIQLSRLSSALFELVMVDPFFFRSSNHPVNDFLHSIIDYEIRCHHQDHEIAEVSDLIDEVLLLKDPSLSDFQSIISRYEVFKQQALENMALEKERQQKDDQQLKSDILELINVITQRLQVETATLEFFYDDWQLLLLQVARNLNKDSSEFKQSVEIARMLAWSLDEQKPENEEYSRYSYASLLKAIDKGLTSLQYSSEHRHRVRKQLLNEFKQINKKSGSTVFTGDPRKPASNLSHFSKMVGLNSFQISGLQPARPRAQFNGKSDGFSSKLEIGAWVDVKQHKSKTGKRAKLKWRSADRSLFIFVDQRGHKVLECDRQTLEHKAEEGEVKLLSNPSLLSRSRPKLGSGYASFNG